MIKDRIKWVVKMVKMDWVKVVYGWDLKSRGIKVISVYIVRVR